jgi:hypothetical protein
VHNAGPSSPVATKGAGSSTASTPAGAAPNFELPEALREFKGNKDDRKVR